MIKSKFKIFFESYYGQLFILAIVVSALLQLLANTSFNHYLYSQVWVIHLVSLAIALLSHAVTSLGFSSKSELHVFFMGGTAVRFLLSLVFLAIAVYVLKNETVVFVLNYFILYLVYTSFEIYFLLRNLRPDLKKDGKPRE